MAIALELRGIVKTFGDLRANDGVDLAVEWGRVHALLGENGAGKSTLMNVVYGLTTPDSGEILFDGDPVVVHGPQDAIRLPVSKDHMANFMEGVRTRKRPICDVAIGHRSATVCHLGNIAVRTRKKIAWDPKTETIFGDAEAAKWLTKEYRKPWSLG